MGCIRKGPLEIGTDADLVIIDFDHEYEFKQENIHSKVSCRHSTGVN